MKNNEDIRLNNQHLKHLLKHDNLTLGIEMTVEHSEIKSYVATVQYNKPIINKYGFKLADELNTTKIYHIESVTNIGGMTISRWLESCDISIDGKLQALTCSKPTNLDMIIGTNIAQINGEELYDGLHLTVTNDFNPKYNHQILTVKVDADGCYYVSQYRGRPRTTNHYQD